VLEYAVMEDRVFLFVLTRGATTATPAIELHEIEAGTSALRRQVRELTRRIASRDLDLGGPAARLYDLLVRPARAAIRARDRIILVPDDVLWELPFQALQPADGRYLVETAAISYAPSVAVLGDMKRAGGNGPGPATLLAMGNPARSEPGVARARGALGPLPDAEREVRTLGRLYGAGTTKTYVGAEAREDVLKAEAGRHRILHLATHGVLDDTSPLHSYVLLTRGSGSEEDGLLEAREIMGLELRADLAVLSACETARGRFGAGEGVVGLSWALFVAGCETTVVSQWKVASESTSDLMLEFHRRLRSGGRKDEALRRAALKVLADRRYRHPFYWAGFIVVGDGD
jgi:CHAT domain-containing protein